MLFGCVSEYYVTLAEIDRRTGIRFVFGLLLASAAWCANGNLYLLLGSVSFVTVRSPRQTFELAFGIFCWFVVGGRCSVR
jgi:hypothetical protein